MRLNGKYFILILSLGACKENTDQPFKKDLPFYAEPFVLQ
jgi:hypothetical protein